MISGDRNTVRNCTVTLTAFNGIYLKGNDNVILNNQFTDISTSAANFTAAVNVMGDRNLVSRNTISHTGRSAIEPCGAGNQIQYNDISFFMQLSSDGGAIYAFGSDGENTRIHHNIIHDATGYCYALYVDGFLSHFCYDHNVIYNIEYHPFHLATPGNFNKLCNNTFYNTFYGACVDLGSNWWGGNAVVHHNDLYGDSIQNNLFECNFDLLSSQNNCIISNNLCQGTNTYYTSPATGDFTLKAGAPAIDQGVEIPGITDSYSGYAPDIGAYESGQEAWTAGCDLTKTF